MVLLSMKTRIVDITATRKLAFESLFLAAYVLLVYISDIIGFSVQQPFAERHFGVILSTLTNLLWKPLFWILPAFLYIIYIEKSHPLTYLKLNVHIRKGVFWGLLISSYLSISTLF